MHWPLRLSRARMYIGVGWLFCVTLPDEIRYGIGVRICAPSMPLPSEPSTRLSRVVPHEACFCTSTSGMPYLANSPLSLATNSGPASLSAMNPSLATFTSGPALSAKAPPGKFNLAAASSAAVPAAPLRIWRRLTPLRGVGLAGFIIELSSFVCCGRPSAVAARGAQGRAPGRPRSGGFTIRMIGFEDGIDGVRSNYSSSVPSRVIKESCCISYTCEDIWFYLAAAGRIRNLRFAQFLCDAQKVGRAFDSRD